MFHNGSLDAAIILSDTILPTITGKNLYQLTIFVLLAYTFNYLFRLKTEDSTS